MKFDINGLMQNPLVLEALKAAPSSGIESVFAARVTDNVVSALRSGKGRDFESACLALGASVFALSPDNPHPLTALKKVSAEQALKASAFRVYEILQDTFTHDFSVERMFTEEGDRKGSLVGVTDPNLIMQTIVAHYAEQAAKRSPFGYRYSSDDDDDDRYNTQDGGSGINVIIDLTNKKVAPVEGLVQTTVQAGNYDSKGNRSNVEYTINVQALRESLAVEGLPGMDSNEVTIIDNTPVKGSIATVTNAANKASLCIRWPNSRFGEINTKGKLTPRETLRKDDTIREEAFVEGANIFSLKEDDPVRVYVETCYGYTPKSNKTFTATRRMLHERITKMINDPDSSQFIAPAFLQNMAYRDVTDEAGNVTRVPCLAITNIKSVYDPSSSSMIGLEGQDALDNHWHKVVVEFNEQHGGEGVQKVLDISSASNTTAEDKAITLPATREACQMGSGNRYKCVVCGKEVKKNGLKQHKPTKLPEGMDANYPGVDNVDGILSSEKYRNSWMCGTCADSLLKQHEAAVKAFRANKQASEAAAAEEEKLLSEGIEAEQQLNAAKELVTKREEEAKKIGEALGNVPEYAAQAVEDAKFNLQQAETRYHSINVKLAGASNKSKAIANGSAIPLPPAPASVKPASKPLGTNLGDAMKATANQAKIISTGERKLTSKERRMQRRAAKAGK